VPDGKNAIHDGIEHDPGDGKALNDPTDTNPASGRTATERGVKLFDNLEYPLCRFRSAIKESDLRCRELKRTPICFSRLS
jgi:hypothetical protein